MSWAIYNFFGGFCMSTRQLRETETRRVWNFYIVHMILISEQKVAAHGCGSLVYAHGCSLFCSFKIFVQRLDFIRKDTDEYWEKYHAVFTEVRKNICSPYNYGFCKLSFEREKANCTLTFHSN